MRTVTIFRHNGREVRIFEYALLSPHGPYVYRAELNGEEIPYMWHDASQLEQAVRLLIDQEEP